MTDFRIRGVGFSQIPGVIGARACDVCGAIVLAQHQDTILTDGKNWLEIHVVWHEFLENTVLVVQDSPE